MQFQITDSLTHKGLKTTPNSELEQESGINYRAGEKKMAYHLHGKKIFMYFGNQILEKALNYEKNLHSPDNCYSIRIC